MAPPLKYVVHSSDVGLRPARLHAKATASSPRGNGPSVESGAVEVPTGVEAGLATRLEEEVVPDRRPGPRGYTVLDHPARPYRLSVEAVANWGETSAHLPQACTYGD